MNGKQDGQSTQPPEASSPPVPPHPSSIQAFLPAFMREISAASDLGHFAATSLNGVASLFAPDLALFQVRKGNDLQVVAAHPLDILSLYRDTLIHKVGECLCGLAVSQGKAVYSGNIHRDPRCTWEECKNAGYTSFAALPLSGEAGIVGVLALGSVRDRDFAQEADGLESIAAAIGIALADALQDEHFLGLSPHGMPRG